MSASYGEARTERVLGATSTTGTIAEAAGSIAVIVLSIIGLAQTTTSATIVAVTAIVLGASLLAEGGALAGEFARLSLLSGESASADSIVSGMSLQVASGGIALVLGILALLGVSAATLTAAAVIVVGAAMMLTASTIPQLRQLRSITSGGSEIVQMIGRTSMSGMAGAQFLAGVAAIVLGILALSSTATETGRTLIMVGFLVVGGAMTIGVTAMSGNFLRFFTR